MFTGIIETIGKVVKYERNAAWIQLPFRRLSLGESVCVDGVCLTASSIRGSTARFDIGPETARITTLGSLKPGSCVNLERALRIGDRLGGHWVTGHVEDRGRIVKIEDAGDSCFLSLKVPAALTRYIIAKGSLTIDGISLTIVSRRKRQVKIMLIPHTLSHTTLGHKRPGDWVNLETDILAKYAQATS
ncbi:MAG: riboflavin synthase [Elusimicrobiota bacterium]|jgi:riboflavin synthase